MYHKFAFILILVMSATTSASEQQKVSVLNSCVTVGLPTTWQKLPAQVDSNSEALPFLIPFHGPLDGDENAGAVLSGVRLPDHVTASQFSDHIISSLNAPASGNVLISNDSDGDWHTLLFRMQLSGLPHTVMSRVGVINHIGVELRVMIPILKADVSKKTAQLINEFNAASKAIAVSCIDVK